MEGQIREEEHKHNWEFVQTLLQPIGDGTVMGEVVYLICHECGTVKKEKVVGEGEKEFKDGE